MLTPALFFGSLATLIAFGTYFALRQTRRARAAWRIAANARAWRFTDNSTSWFKQNRIEIHGECYDIPFHLRMTAGGQQSAPTTILTCPHSDCQYFRITPTFVASRLFVPGNVTTGDVAYDKQFTVESVYPNWLLAGLNSKLRERHLALPCSIQVSGGSLHLSVERRLTSGEDVVALIELGTLLVSSLRGRSCDEMPDHQPED